MMNKPEFQQLMERVFLLWPRVQNYLNTASPDPAGTLQAWHERVKEFDLSLALAMVTKMNSGKLESIGHYPSDSEYCCDLIARHCRAALAKASRQRENEAILEAGGADRRRQDDSQATKEVQSDPRTKHALARQRSWYNELYNFYEVPDDGRNRMMLAAEMGVRDKILQEVKNRLEEYFRDESQAA